MSTSIIPTGSFQSSVGTNGETFQRRHTLNDTFSQEQWKQSTGGAQKQHIDIVDKIRISYELISKKGAPVRGSNSPPAGVVTTAGQDIDEGDECVTGAYEGSGGGPQRRFEKKLQNNIGWQDNKVIVQQKMTRGHTKRALKVSSIQVDNIQYSGGAGQLPNQLEFNTTFSQGFKQQLKQSNVNSQSLGGGSSTDQDALATTAATTTTFKRTGGSSTNPENSLAFLRLPQIGNNRTSLVIAPS